LVPITPFSALAVWPLVGAAALVAKHRWLVLNAAPVVGRSYLVVVANSRFGTPAVSPDGRWLAFSELQSGN
jgi:hypothetical protein